MLALRYAVIFQFIKNIKGIADFKYEEENEKQMVTMTVGDEQYAVPASVFFPFSALHDQVMESECYKNDNYALSISRLNFLLAIVQNLDYIQKNAKNDAKDMTINDPSPLHIQRIEEAVSEMNKAFEVMQTNIHTIEASTTEFKQVYNIFYKMRRSALDNIINSMKSSAYKTVSEVADLRGWHDYFKQEHEFTSGKLAVDVSDDVKKLLDEIEDFFRGEVTDQELTEMASGTAQEEENRT